MDVDGLLAWIAGYEKAWRSPGTALLAELFAADATYLKSPYEQPVVGLDAIARMWDEERDGPGEVFSMSREVVSVSEDTGVVRVEVRYGEPVRQEYRDLWVVRFGPDGRAVQFEEWPFWPEHGWSPVRADPVVVPPSAATRGYEELVRSGWLSAGVYVLPAGGRDDQLPHTEDEVYVVLAGEAVLEVDGARTPVQAGSLAYVPAQAQHRFTDIVGELRVVVVFAPPESSRAAQ